MDSTIKRTITDVLNVENGQCIDANDFFMKPLDELTVYRSELQKAINGFRDPLFKCYYCKQLIRIRGGKSESSKRKAEIFHFAHLKDSDDCHIKTNNQFTKEEVERIKYNGSKESLLHKNIKERIAECLKRNETALNGISHIEVERVISDKLEKEWKKPDINAFYNSKRIAIELQLSTTWLDVITRRQYFYKENSIYILWIFHEFDVNDNIRMLTFNDVIYTNNQNAYVFDDEMYNQSIAENDLVLRCYYKKYSRYEYSIKEDWVQSIIRLSELTFEETKFRVFYHDSEKQKREVEQEIQRKKRIDEIAFKEQVDRMNEKKRLNEKLEKEREEKNRIRYTQEKKLRSEIAEIKVLMKEYFYEAEILKERLAIKTNMLADLDSYVDGKIQELLKPTANTFKNNDTNKVWNEFGETLRSANKTKSIHENKLENLVKKINQNKDLPTIKIADQELTSLDKIKFWNFIEDNYTKIKLIKKDSIGNLFEGEALKSINSNSELLQYKNHPNYLFFMDLSSRIKDLEDKIKDTELAISKQESIILATKDKIKNKLEVEVSDEILDIKVKLKECTKKREKLAGELRQKEGG